MFSGNDCERVKKFMPTIAQTGDWPEHWKTMTFTVTINALIDTATYVFFLGTGS